MRLSIELANRINSGESFSENGKNYYFFMTAYRSYVFDLLSCRLNSKYKQFLQHGLIESLSFQVDSYLKEHIFQYVIQHEKDALEAAGFLEGETSEDKEVYFIHRISNTTDWIFYLFEKYPALENRVEIYTKQTISYIYSIINNYCLDRNHLAKLGITNSSKIADIELFIGDTHKEGKFVVKCIFDDGHILMYKPRPSYNEQIFINLLCNLNEAGINIKARVPSFVSIDNHSWCEYVISNDIHERFKLSDYYYNLGKLSCVLYAIGASDIISDNIMCIDGIPTIIDLECVNTIKLINVRQTCFANYFDRSIISVGMLPVWKYSSMNERNTLSSALFVSEHNDHLPRVNGKFHGITKTTKKCFIRGFSECYKRLLNFDYLHFVREFQSHDQRILIHDTSLYSYLQRETYLPEYLHGDLDITRLVEHSIPPIFIDYVKEITGSIINQIHHNDIPFFYVSQRQIKDGYDNILLSLDRVETIERQLSNIDLAFQIKVIETSIDHALEASRNSVCCRHVYGAKIYHNKNLFFDAAKRIVSDLYKDSLQLEDEVNWVAKSVSRIDGRYQADVLDESIYDGSAGIALLFSQMHLICDNREDYLRLSNIIKNNIRDVFYRRKQYKSLYDNWSESNLISHHYFPLSYAFLSCYDSYNDNIDHKFIEDALQNIDDKILHDCSDCGYLGGIAGYIDFLIELKRNRLHEVTEHRIINAYNKLLSLEVKQNGLSLWPHSEVNKGQTSSVCLGGFSHGSSGIAYVLYKLYKLMGDETINRRFMSTLNYDRSFYDNNTHTWRDGRLSGTGQDMGSWCHGAGGIALSRILLIKEGYHDDLIFEELKHAVSIIKNSLGRNHCVCHGDSGNLEILYMIGETMNDKSLCEFAESSMLVLASRIKNREPIVYGDGKEMATLGLFLGKAGLGYQMLRFYNWSSVPSILFLDLSKINYY